MVYAGLVSLDIFSFFFGTSCSRRGVSLTPGFCYVCVCVDLAHLVFCEREREQVRENVEWVNLCGVCLCLYVSKIVAK